MKFEEEQFSRCFKIVIDVIAYKSMVSEFCANYLPQYMITCSQRGKTLVKGGVWREYAKGA